MTLFGIALWAWPHLPKLAWTGLLMSIKPSLLCHLGDAEYMSSHGVLPDPDLHRGIPELHVVISGKKHNTAVLMLS